MIRIFLIGSFLSFTVFGVPVKLFAQNLDIDILKSINPTYPNSRFWKATSSSTYYISAGVGLGTLIYGLTGDDVTVKQHSYELFLNYGISTLTSEVLKISINRTRPADRYPGEIFVSSPVHGQSFPSGHATLAFSTATALSLEYPKWYVIVPAYLWAGSVGYSRLYLGKHYPSDVLGGAVIGIGSGYISRWLNRQILRPYKSKLKDHE
jgi:membrane-associated phospholipid phosphatase